MFFVFPLLVEIGLVEDLFYRCVFLSLLIEIDLVEDVVYGCVFCFSSPDRDRFG